MKKEKADDNIEEGKHSCTYVLKMVHLKIGCKITNNSHVLNDIF